VLAACWAAIAAPALAGVSVSFDRQTLNDLLPALTVNAIVVPLTDEQSIEVFLEDLEVTGFDPTAGVSGQILTSMRLRVPQLGLDVVVESRLSLRVREQAQSSELEMRFERAELPLPLVGRIDVAGFLPPLRFPARNLFHIAGAQGEVQIVSKLSGIEMGQKVLRLTFDLEARLAN
jgi:hypothetical protein